MRVFIADRISLWFTVSAPPPPPSPRFTFRASHRLTHATQFAAVYAYRLRKSRGPLSLAARPNDLPHLRLGLAISKSVGGIKKGPKGAKAGTAIIRNRLKRLLREAFRLQQHDLLSGPPYCDLVLSARPHALLTLDDYQRLVRELVSDVAAELERRHRRNARASDESPRS